MAQFVPRADRDAKTNLTEFIRLAREELTAFDGGGAWDCDKWKHSGGTVVFATRTAPLGAYSHTPMAEPFKEFAKAYVRYSYSHRSVKSMDKVVQGLRCIEAALLHVRGPADIRRLNLAVMDVCAAKCREFFPSLRVQYATGLRIQAIFDFVREKRLVPTLPPWKSPFRLPASLTVDVSEAGQAYRTKKLPSNQAMLAVADLFAQANDPETRYFSSIMMLLMAAPSRISEVLRLPTDCIQWEPDERGVRQMYLRWHAAKGKGATKKWVVPVMHDVVHEAVRRLIDIGQGARESARFAFENPGRFMPHSACLADPDEIGDRPLTPDELCAAIGLKLPERGDRLRDGSPAWSRISLTEKLQVLIDRAQVTYFDLANYVSENYRGPYWPHIDEARLVKAWDSLCVHRENEFHKQLPVKLFSWRLPGKSDLNTRLTTDRGMSIFERYGLKNSDGTSIRLTPHQPRHWLSTMSERAGMDEYTLAQWAGRVRVADNRHYDHRSPEERLEAARDHLPFKPAPLLERIKHRQPVTYQELGMDRLGTAKATLYGMCVHDYAMAPCQKERECMTCAEHVCIKGDHVSLERIRLLEAQTELLLQKAQKAHEDGDFGADRWVDNHKWKLAHVRAMRTALEHPQVPDGTILRIPDGHDPSPVRRALMELRMVEVPSVEAIVPAVLSLKPA